MKKLLLMLTVALVATGCNKEKHIKPPAPAVPDIGAPISFGATNSADVTPTRTAAMGMSTIGNPDLGIYAFIGAVFIDGTVAEAKDNIWGAAEGNRMYTSPDKNDKYNEFVASGDKLTLYWPTTIESRKVQFRSYLPYMALSTTNSYPTGGGRPAYLHSTDYTLHANLADQAPEVTTGILGSNPTVAATSTVAEHTNMNNTCWFAWEGVDAKRPEPPGPAEPFTPQPLVFNYKMAKISLVIKGDGIALGRTSLSIGKPYEAPSDPAALDTDGIGVVSIKIYNPEVVDLTTSTGLNRTYALNLLTGITTGTDLANHTNELPAIELTPALYAAANTKGPNGAVLTENYVGAVGYLVPTTLPGNTTPCVKMSSGMAIEIVYNDGTEDKLYTAYINAKQIIGVTNEIKSANLTYGLKEGSNYKYTLTLRKIKVDFTAQVQDWGEGVVEGGDITLD